MSLAFALVAAAAGIGSVHTLAPDHWMPFAALARAERWKPARTAAITALCGLGHVTVSAALGLLSVLFGLELLQAFGRRLEGVAGLLLVAFGVVYASWGLHRRFGGQWHGHADGPLHAHHRGHARELSDLARLTPWTLFALFSADPCVAVIPLMFAAAPLGWSTILAVVAAYEAATIATMVALVLPARAAAASIGGDWVNRYGDVLAGAVIAIVGIVDWALG